MIKMFDRVAGANSDCRGIVRDVHVRVFPSYCVPVTKVKTVRGKIKHPNDGGSKVKIQATILHRDVSRIVVLLPTEEQSESQIYKLE